LFAYTELHFDLYQGQLCRTALLENGSVLQYTIEYHSADLGPEPVEVTYNFGYNVAALGAQNLEDRDVQNRAIDRLLKDTIISVVGGTKLYKVSDEPLSKFGSQTAGLRLMLDKLHEEITRTWGQLSGAKLLEYFANQDNRYQGRGKGSIAFVYREGDKSFEIWFARGLNGMSVEKMLFDGTEIPATP
jgi:hypothetical protein